MAKKKRKAFLLADHSSWGKSATLTALTNGNYCRKRMTIKGCELFIRRTSNDDDDVLLAVFINRLDSW